MPNLSLLTGDRIIILKTDLRDYAHKEWNGLLSSLYYNRWKEVFIEEAQAGAITAPEVFYNMEVEWSKGKEMYIPQKINTSQMRIITGENSEIRN